MSEGAIIKRHGCGRVFTLSDWIKLPYAGDMKDDVEHIELRNCPCGSTLSLLVVYEDDGSRFYKEDDDAGR